MILMKVDVEKIKKNKSVEELLEFGILNIDKPSGPTSFDTSEKVMKLLGLRKTSHFGTLDPKVTGVLPIALNRACKLTGFFLGEDKEYIGTMQVHEIVDLEKMKKAIVENFTGKIIQLPPVKSRVKRQHREREVKKFEILEVSGKDILFQVECQGGTYIRKLVHDLGEDLKVGAHMTELRRVRAGIFKEAEIHTLYEFKAAVEAYKKGDDNLLRKMLIPGEIVSELFPVVKIKEESADRILHGQPIYDENLLSGTSKSSFEKEDKISVFSEDKFIGVFKVMKEGRVFAKAEFVLQPIN